MAGYKPSLTDEEKELVKLIAEYETARVHAAFAKDDVWPEAARYRDRAADALAAALTRHRGGFWWGRHRYGVFKAGSYRELMRVPAPRRMGSS